MKLGIGGMSPVNSESSNSTCNWVTSSLVPVYPTASVCYLVIWEEVSQHSRSLVGKWGSSSLSQVE